MFQFFKKVAVHQTEKITIAAFIISVASFFSFALGLLRDRLLTSSFGAGNELDVYYTAFRIPDFVALVLMMGAISVAIIPIFTQNLLQDKKKAFNYLANLLNLAFIFLVIVCFILFIFTPQLISLIAPGFAQDKKNIAIELTRIMFLSPILMGISNIISAVLMVFKRFLITSLAPIVYNLGSIMGILFFVPIMGITGLAWGIVLGAGLHLLIQLPSLIAIGFVPQKIYNFKDKDILQTIKLTIPRAIGLTATQINLIIITAIGSTLFVGSVSVFSLAYDLTSPILGLIAIPFATAVFPALSLAYSKNDINDYLDKFYLALRQILFLLIPASGLAFILRAHLVRIVFGAGLFDWSATKLTAACFGIFMFGLFAQGLIFLFSRAFFAIKNTIIPTLASLFAMILVPIIAKLFIYLLGFENGFSLFVMQTLKIDAMANLPVIGLPLAISIGAIMQVIVLAIFLKIKIKQVNFKKHFLFLGQVIVSTIIMISLAYIVRQIFGGFLGSKTFIVMFLQTTVVGFFGIAIYTALVYAMRLPETKTIKYFINKLVG